VPGMSVDPSSFVPDVLAGFCDLYQEYVQPVPGGVVRSRVTRPGKVALVIGGGSGHYPAFAGYVGPGLADGAVVGNIFASPSTRQARDVARAAEQGAGLLLAYGNYAGDVLNFELAAERLRAEGVDTEVLAVTDDVASAPADQRGLRRGVAGDVVVFKVAGAAAERGETLPEVLRLARSANDVTRSFGVAFSGGTVPGAAEPLFSLPEGMMGVGLGVHGEPGIAEQPLCSARELAALLVDRLVDEAPPGGVGDGRPVALLNGLGATKYEELFHLWHHIRRRLAEHGIEPAAVEAGELVTSLDMAGCSLTLAWLDAAALELWAAPVQTPALRRGPEIPTRPAPPAHVEPVPPLAPGDGKGNSHRDVVALRSVLAEIGAALAAAEGDLNRLDAVAGDGDHGRSMLAGARAAEQVAAQAEEVGADLATALAAAADAWCDAAGGTSGALWSAGLRGAAASVQDDGARPDPGRGPRAAQAALDAITRLGGAEIGDKTMVDALAPLVEGLHNGGWLAGAQAAERAAEDTAPLRPRIGRARPLAERSVGHRDPGAASLALCASAAARVLEAELSS
jgi:dihydroxyacetone kinase